MNIFEKLQVVQRDLKAPKGQFNKFGNYKYRSCEDILEAVKPILDKVGAVITVCDSIEHIGDRYYIKATASFFDIKSGEQFVQNSAFAREPEAKKGMDESQITGTASSYARKYALNGLLLIDDTKDADTNENREERSKRSEGAKQPTAGEMLRAVAAYAQGNADAYQILVDEAKRAGVKDVSDLAKANPHLITALWNKWCQ